MENENLLKKLDTEDYYAYTWRVDQLIQQKKFKNWEEVTPIVNKELYGDNEEEYLGESAHRKKVSFARQYFEAGVFGAGLDEKYLKELEIQKREIARLKVQYRDERAAWNKQNTIEGRVEAKLDILEEEIISSGKIDYPVYSVEKTKGNNDILVMLSDLHIGATFDSSFGKYDSDVAKDRLAQYLAEIKETKELYGSENCYVQLLGDFINGSIHKSIAITNRENVIEQIKLVSELVSSFVYELGKVFSEVFVIDVTGNHTRIDKKEDSLHDERLDALVTWYMNGKLSHVSNVHIIKNELDTSISSIEIRGKKYIGVHGDYDSFSKSGVANLVMMLGYKPYAVLFGHMHTPKLDDMSGVKAVMGGSLCGSGDSYTIEKRLNGKASQTMCICTEKGIKAVIPVVLN